MKIPVLFLGSREDEMCRRALAQEYGEKATQIIAEFISCQ